MTKTSDINWAAIDTVVFDLGGVLIDWNPRYLYRKLIHDEQEIEQFLSEVCHSSWNEKHDAGQPFAKGVADLISLHPEKESLIRAYYDRWEEMLSGPIEGTVRILEQLRCEGRYRLLGLSNWSSETFPIARRRFPFLNHFETILVSGEEKLIKPDRRFYQILIDRLKVNPERALFIDDVEKNIVGARALGIQAYRFVGSEDLRQVFTNNGILLEK